jgi:hypothetical protein
MTDIGLTGVGEQYDRIKGFKILAVFEDHTGGGTARIFYAVHPDGRGLVQISSRNPAHGDATHPRWTPHIYADHEQARAYFILTIQRYVPQRSSVA